MKTKTVRIAALCCAILVTMAMFAFTGCPGGDESLRSGATFTGITIGGISPATTGLAPAGGIPAPITSSVWDSGNLPQNHSVYTGRIYAVNAAAVTNAEIVVTGLAGGATANFGAAMGTFAHPASFSSNNVLTLANNEVVYVRVTAEDGTRLFYRFLIIIMSDNVNVTSIRIVYDADAIPPSDVVATGFGTPVATIDAITTWGTLGLGAAQRTNVNIVAATTVAAATSEYAVRRGGNFVLNFADTGTVTLNDGDQIIVRVTAVNGVTVGYYGITVEIGRVATLTGITFNQHDVLSMGTPHANTANVANGLILLPYSAEAIALDGGVDVVAAASDSDATARFRVGDTGVFVNSGNGLVFVDGSVLWIQVTSANEAVVLYYAVTVNTRQPTNILMRTMNIQDNVIDPQWNAPEMEVLHINRVHPNYVALIEQWETLATWGEARLAFDEDGLYIFAQVWDSNVTPGPGGEHNADSVELFFNERAHVTIPGWGSGGSQYRVGADGSRSGGRTNPGWTTSAHWGDRISRWNFTGDARTFNGVTLDSGYIVIFQVPWRVIGTDDPLIDGMEIAVEIQINASSAVGSRDGVVVWNNIAHSNWQNMTAWGQAFLDFDGGILPVHAVPPTITTQPQSQSVGDLSDIVPLTVAANASDGGTVSFQWYTGNPNDATRTPVSGATGTTFTPVITTEGAHTFYVVVTNTNTAPEITGNTTATTVSNVATITFLDAAVTHFYLDLNMIRTEQATGGGGQPWEGNPLAPPSVVTGGVLTWDFSRNDQRGLIDLRPADVTRVNAHRLAGGTISVVIDGVATPDSQFRFGLANPMALGSWNGTTLPAGAFSSFLAPAALAWQNPGGAPAVLSSFKLQLREATPTEVTINSIRIDLNPID
ncbi:MAG: hypothetical protein FWC97_01275 [Treponema sp.]|nr:hypothetical protein [Treponema sp.]